MIKWNEIIQKQLGNNFDLPLKFAGNWHLKQNNSLLLRTITTKEKEPVLCWQNNNNIFFKYHFRTILVEHTESRFTQFKLNDFEENTFVLVLYGKEGYLDWW